MKIKNKLPFLKKVVHLSKKYKEQMSKLEVLFGNDEGSFQETMDEIMLLLIGNTSKLIDDKDDYLEWFIYENDFGKKEFDIIDNGVKFKVKTEEDLLKIIK